MHQEDALAVDDRAATVHSPYPTPERLDVDELGERCTEAPRRAGAQGPSARGEAHIAVLSSTVPVLDSGNARTIASTAKEARSSPLLAVHPALGVRHAVPGEGREVAVQHPAVGPDLAVQRDGRWR